MGLLDKAVKKEIEKKEQKTKEEMDKLSAEVQKLKWQKDIAEAPRPFIKQGLKEFISAMEQIGVEPLPLVVVKNPYFFSDEKPIKCMWGYYLYPRINDSCVLFMTADGKYHAAITTFSSDRKVTDSNKTRVDFKPPKPRMAIGQLCVETLNIHEEEISEDEAVSIVTENFVNRHPSPSNSDIAMNGSIDNDHLETAVAELFSSYIAYNVSYNDYLLRERDKLEYLRSLNRK